MRQRFNPYKKSHRPPQPKQQNLELLRAIRDIQLIPKSGEVQPEKTHVSHSSFDDFAIAPQIKANIAYKQYTVPTPIQDQAIPHILQGRDVVGIAQTGTGKTAAFLIPLIDKVFHNKSEKVLIIAPTRELALQIYEELKAFSRGLGMASVLCIGGMSLVRQKNELRQKVNFVIGTPGRIKELITIRDLHMGQFNSVVLDEADRMVDIGFIKDIKYFISLLPQNRQSLFFSATVSGKVAEILKEFIRNGVTVSVKKHETADNIHQEVIHVSDKSRKIDRLHELLIQKEFEKVIIFGRTKHGVQKLSNELVKRGFKAGAIHGNKKQNQRTRILDSFKKNEINILLATDVASRGLDIDNVSHVINYDMPSTMDDYVHRIGRTGRADKKGVALTFVE